MVCKAKQQQLPTTKQDSLASAPDGMSSKRRPLIGRNFGLVPDLVGQRRKKMLPRFLPLAGAIGLQEGNLVGDEKQDLPPHAEFLRRLSTKQPIPSFEDTALSISIKTKPNPYVQLEVTVTLTPITSHNISSSSSTKSIPSRVQSASSPYAPSPHLSPLLPLPLSMISMAQTEQQEVPNLGSLRPALLKGSATAVGGEGMDITSRTHSRTPMLVEGLVSGSWGHLVDPGVVPAHGPPSTKSSLGTIHSNCFDGPDFPLSAR
ncbi:hypothetical protein BDP27DRAFT_1419065 [Rhodocollybia butyracea]|uniref:Uncharacterized protein n=1 Tax=Rhodocollybia butyracea TaxID=206335 RepID=A0A9P5PX10_9AGAR|nr:hypothetical protein BDP27DRAFT_1419065 [Rhodocollybia butyracea]